MLHLLDTALERYLRAETPLPRDEVDVVFVAPDRDWATTLNRPTVNLFLWDILRSTKLARSGSEVIEREGQLLRRPVPPCFELRYLVSAWTTDIRDEHQLLGAVLATLAGADRLPDAYVPPALEAVHPLPTLSVGTHPDGQRHELWSAVGGRLKPAFDLTVTAAVEPTLAIPLAPRVAGIHLTVAKTDGGGANGERDTGDAGVSSAAANAARAPRPRRWRLRRRPGGEQGPDAVDLRSGSMPPSRPGGGAR